MFNSAQKKRGKWIRYANICSNINFTHGFFKSLNDEIDRVKHKFFKGSEIMCKIKKLRIYNDKVQFALSVCSDELYADININNME